MVKVNTYKDEMYPVWYPTSTEDNWPTDYEAEVDEKELEEFYKSIQNFHHWQNWLEDKSVKKIK